MTTRKLPLWKGLLETIEEKGVEYGKTYSAAWFEEELSCKRDSREFGLAVHRIRVCLERKGFYLQGHTMKEGNLVILPPEKNIGIAKATERKIRKNRARSIHLLGSTDRELLPSKFRPQHEKMLMRITIRQMIEARAGRIHKYLKKKMPKLLEVRV